jgi:hypothetical protein
MASLRIRDFTMQLWTLSLGKPKDVSLSTADPTTGLMGAFTFALGRPLFGRKWREAIYGHALPA